MPQTPFNIIHDFPQPREVSPPPLDDDRQADLHEGGSLKDRIILVAAAIEVISGAMSIVEKIVHLLS
jgi:hypothetical protein